MPMWNKEWKLYKSVIRSEKILKHENISEINWKWSESKKKQFMHKKKK